jgi:hypothetical protein
MAASDWEGISIPMSWEINDAKGRAVGVRPLRDQPGPIRPPFGGESTRIAHFSGRRLIRLSGGQNLYLGPFVLRLHPPSCFTHGQSCRFRQ